MIKTPFSRMKTGIQYRPYFFISFVITIVLYAIFQTSLHGHGQAVY